jgi:hypothetical protein
LRELRCRNKQLEQENKILRRATAYFARDTLIYQWRADPVSQRDWDDARSINAALDIHHDDPGFGYRFIADELPARGITAGRNRVGRLCSQ